MSAKKIVTTDKAPKPIGPYSQAVMAGNTVYLAGMVAIDPASGAIVPGGIKEQTRRVLESVKGILEASGSSLDRVVKATVYLKDASMFAEMNQVYSEYFGETKPARATVIAGMVRPEMLVEIEVIATLD